MRNLIIFYSRYGSTRNTALKIKDVLPNTDMIEVELIQSYNLTDYDRIIFGSNVMMGKLNKKIVKCIKKNKKVLKNKKKYGFILCVNKPLYVERYFHLLANLLETDKIYYLGGVLDSSKADNTTDEYIIECLKKGVIDQGITIRGIDESAIIEFVNMIKKDF